MTKSKSLRFAALLGAVVVIGAAALSAGPAFAAKGGNGGGQTGGSATLSVSPNPVPAWTSFDLSGCGYVPGEGVQLTLYTNFAITSRNAVADVDGCIAVPTWGTSAAGSYTLKAATGSRNTVVASITFQVF